MSTQSYKAWAGHATGRAAITDDELGELFAWTAKHGSGNGWTGDTGRIATLIRYLLADRERLLAAPRPKQRKAEGEAETRGRKPTATSDESFDRFWLAYPCRAGKGVALKAWEKAKAKADAETIIQAAAEFAASPKGRGEFVPHPATWLNQERWLDDRSAWGEKVLSRKTSASLAARDEILSELDRDPFGG